MLISIDPGLRHCGVARWDENGNLVEGYLAKNTERMARGPEAWKAMAYAVFLGEAANATRLVVECPRVYPNAQQKGDQNDLIELAGVVGAISGVFDVNVAHQYPSDWKGQLPKDVMNLRVLQELSERERARLKHKDHNTLDAVGIGLFTIGRIGKKKVFR